MSKSNILAIPASMVMLQILPYSCKNSGLDGSSVLAPFGHCHPSRNDSVTCQQSTCQNICCYFTLNVIYIRSYTNIHGHRIYYEWKLNLWNMPAAISLHFFNSHVEEAKSFKLSSSINFVISQAVVIKCFSFVGNWKVKLLLGA